MNAGGESGPPLSLGSSLLTNIVEIRADLALPKSTPALPHELGHYFGLKHPHVKQSGDELDTRYDYEREMNRWYQRNPGIDPFELLREYLGDDYSFDPSTHYLPYNASSAEGSKFEAFRSAVMKFYLRYSYLYRGELQEVATLADFETMGSAGEFMYHKNWVGEREADGSVPGNNCHWDAVSAGMICEYPEFDTVLDGSDSLVDGTIYLEGGSRNNIMSYIRFPEWNIEDPQCIFTEAQIKVIRLHANVAGLGGRRNFLQSYAP